MQEDSEIKAKKNEALKVTNKQKKLTPKQIINKALNKEKADKLKSEIRLEHGVRTLYWNHTKNYSKQMQLEESNYVAENVKKYTLHKFLKFFMEKPYHFSMIRKFVHEYLQKEALKPEDRYLIWKLLSGATANKNKNPNYYACLNATCVGPSKHFKRIIDMDVKRTEEALNDAVHAEKLTNILLNFSKRNSRIGYCQGLNFIASYFLKHLKDEEDVFWIICYIIEESMPNEYYTNMLSVLADMQIVQLIFSSKYSDLSKHFKKAGVGLEMVALPCFITLFTNCPSSLVDIIIDFFFMDGPITLIKAIIIMFGYMRKKLLKVSEIGSLNRDSRAAHKDYQRLDKV